MRLRTGGDDSYVTMRAVRRVRTVAWVAVVLGVLLLPWPPGVLLLSTSWQLTKSRQKTPFREQLLRTHLQLRRVIGISVAVFVYALMQLSGAFCGGGNRAAQIWAGCDVNFDSVAAVLVSIFSIQSMLCLPMILVAAALMHELHVAHKSLDPGCDGQSSHSSVRFSGNPRDIISGQPKEAATGIYGFIGHTEKEIRAKMALGIAAIVEEWEAHGSAEDMENLRYVLYEPAGSSTETFHHGWLRDRAPDGSELPGRQGMLLADFMALKSCHNAQLEESHVVALRLYTTSAFRALNNPMRNLKLDPDGEPVQPPKLAEPHKLPVTMAFMYEGLKRLRAAAAIEEDARATLSGAQSFLHSTDVMVVSRDLDELGDPALSQRPAVDAKEQTQSSAPMQPMRGWSAGSPSSRGSLNDMSARSAKREARSKRTLTSSRTATSERSMADLEASNKTDAPRAALRLPSRQLMRGLTVQVLAPQRAHKSRAPDTILWRGMQNLQITDKFLAKGGTELAPMSTTTNLDIAVRYSRGAGSALIFRLRSTSFMNLGCDLTELSAFPHEKEYLYPSLTFLHPTGKTHKLVHGGTTFTVVEVEPSFPS